MAQIQLYYIGTSKIKTIRSGASITWDWGSYGPWTSFKSPAAKSTKKVTYDKKAKNKAGKSKYGGTGGKTVLGTSIPSRANRTVDGVVETVDVRYYQRGYTVYNRTAKLKKDKKMQKKVYTSSKPYQYRLQYKDKKIKNTNYSSYSNGMDYIYFADKYWANGAWHNTTGHLLHPNSFALKYSDVRRNFDTSSANNSDGRDNQGSFVLKNVRNNVVILELGWGGLTSEEAADLLDTLNPSSEKDYLVVQYRDPSVNDVRTKTFYASERSVEKYPNGSIKSIKVTLTEV